MINQNLSNNFTLPAKNRLKIFLFLLLVLAVAAGSFFAGIQIGEKQVIVRKSTLAPASTSLPTNLNSATSPSQDWKTAKFGSLFSFDYPAGWHVAELWQENYAQNGIRIAIDPNPINTAPKGGPLATFEINILNGNKNPDEILADRIGSFSQDNYSDITQETINAEIGKIYHFKGKIAGEMLQGQPVENYFFTFNQKAGDPFNQQVVIATMSLKDDPQLSALLKHIVLSFKKLTL